MEAIVDWRSVGAWLEILTREWRRHSLFTVVWFFLIWQEEKPVVSGMSRSPAYGALAHLYTGKDINQIVDKIKEKQRSGLIDEYYDIKACDPIMDFTTAK